MAGTAKPVFTANYECARSQVMVTVIGCVSATSCESEQLKVRQPSLCGRVFIAMCIKHSEQ